MKKEEHRFKVGDKVFAKVKGYPPWPAIVLEENGKKYKVKFYGTGEMGQIKIEDLSYYTQSKQKLLKPTKRKDFNDSVKEIEQAIKAAGTDGSPNYNNDKSDDVVSNDSVLNDADTNSTLKKRKRSLSVVKSQEDGTPAKSKRRKTSVSVEEPRNSSPVSEELIETKQEDLEKIKLEKKDGGHEKNVDTLKDAKEKPVITPKKEIPVKPSITPEQNDKSVEIIQPKDFVMEKDLEAWIAYGEYVEKHEDIYSKMLVEERYESDVQVLPIFSEKKAIGIKLHETWPLKAFKNEYERALYDKEISQRVLNLKKFFKYEQVKESPSVYYENLEITEDNLNKLCQDKLVAIKEDIMGKLKIESSLLELDSKIKSCLNLDKAEPKKAIVLLEEMLTLQVNAIMLTKHAHVVDVVRRLRKYVGNIKSWNLTEEEKIAFRKDAEEVRNTALKVYVKFMQIIGKPSEAEAFWDAFNDIATKFREDTKSLSESEFYMISCPPHSRKNFMNNYFIKEISINISLKNDATKDSENDATVDKDEKSIKNNQ